MTVAADDRAMERDQMLCGLTRPAIEAGLVGEIDQQARRERANRERSRK
jgi:hypothetical protein